LNGPALNDPTTISAFSAVALASFTVDATEDDEKSVFAELCQVGEETVKLYDAERRPLPAATSGYDWSNTITNTTTTS
jgi:hypothetical protein